MNKNWGSPHLAALKKNNRETSKNFDQQPNETKTARHRELTNNPTNN